ncbi:MAG: hypothetical protein KAW91_03050, partial [candidate division Zixibacteria bacterium]|nr:hypothetical protein [candidate division Zixibacteria bacterium]
MKTPEHSYYASATGRCGDVEQSQIHVPCDRDNYNVLPIWAVCAWHQTNPTTTGVLAEVRKAIGPPEDRCR